MDSPFWVVYVSGVDWHGRISKEVGVGGGGGHKRKNEWGMDPSEPGMNLLWGNIAGRKNDKSSKGR
jgi:hypothetical protein